MAELKSSGHVSVSSLQENREAGRSARGEGMMAGETADWEGEDWEIKHVFQYCCLACTSSILSASRVSSVELHQHSKCPLLRRRSI